MATSSSFIALSFFIIQLLGFVKTNKQIFNSKPAFKAEKNLIKAHVVPLLVNLKGEEGPQLARINVYITPNGHSFKKEFLSQNNKLEKHLLFVLSGQPIANLSKRKTHFEKQIQSQLNTFSTKNLINKVHIQTKMLN